MKFLEQALGGVYRIDPEPFSDNRGSFRRVFCEREFSDRGIAFDVKQSSVSENKLRGTLRGFHYQHPPFQEGKTFSCIRGSVHDIVVDLRPHSSTYLKWIALKIGGDDHSILYVPPGCANAYLTLEDDTQLLYFHSEFYTAKAEGGIRYDDPFFKFKWPLAPVVVSEKDKGYPAFAPAS